MILPHSNASFEVPRPQGSIRRCSESSRDGHAGEPSTISTGEIAIGDDAKKVLNLSEQQARNAVKVNYDDRVPFVLCAGALEPLYKGAEVVRSPYCGAAYGAKYKGTLCAVDGLSQVGLETLGLVCSSVQARAK